jgi:ribosomal protein S18 acetylase RimI-like enzyme
VTIRRQSPGGLRDSVGILRGWDGAPAGTLRVETRDGSVVEIKATDVFAARVVPPEVSSLRLQEIAEAAWPTADHEQLGDWTLRSSGGAARRTNSVRVSGVPSGDLANAFDYVREWYARRQQRALVQSPVPGAFDALLLADGWEPDSESHFMIRTLPKEIGPEIVAPVDVEIGATPSNDWLTIAAPDMARGLAEPMSRAASQRFITVYEDDIAVAVGRLALHDSWGIVTSVRTTSAVRRSGHATTVMRAIDDVAHDLGIKALMLQVLIDNEAAIGLYQGLGYTTHHRYRYLMAPEI